MEEIAMDTWYNEVLDELDGKEIPDDEDQD
jgi:hypothetical protein